MGGPWDGFFMVGVVCAWRAWWLKNDVERMESEMASMEHTSGYKRTGCIVTSCGYDRCFSINICL
jgi:hypothetical protein